MVCVSTPSSSIVPELGSMRRLIIRIDVVFPQPDGPTRAVIFPLGAAIVSLSTATVPSGYTLDTSSNVIMTVLLGREISGNYSVGQRRPQWQRPTSGRTASPATQRAGS